MTREEAIKVAYGIPVTKEQHEALQFLIPELAESEDERTRKIITLALIASEEELSDFYSVHNITRKECTDWLERQKEDKPVWSEEDEIYLQDALWCVKQASKVARGENDMGACWSAERWLKSLPERLNLQQKERKKSVWHDASKEKPTKLPIVRIWYEGKRVSGVNSFEGVNVQPTIDEIVFQPNDKWAYLEDLLEF